ncbi:MAG: hypothetical protein JKY70_05595 [Mucilaginibacter sp.]|nr:hypothetical protein [Mucilaginibacter sp.]
MSDLTEITNEKTCLECGQPLGPGRDDRKYCNDICRTAYNNRRRKDEVIKSPETLASVNPEFQKLYEILLANRTTLMMWDTYKEEPYMLIDLLGKGFNLKYFTSECEIEGLPFKFCFDYGYHITSTGRVYIEERSSETFC